MYERETPNLRVIKRFTGNNTCYQFDTEGQPWAKVLSNIVKTKKGKQENGKALCPRLMSKKKQILSYWNRKGKDEAGCYNYSLLHWKWIYMKTT